MRLFNYVENIISYYFMLLWLKIGIRYHCFFFLLLLGYPSIGSSKNYLKWLTESPRIFLRLFGISTRNINDSLFIESCEIQENFENSDNEVHPSPSAITFLSEHRSGACQKLYQVTWSRFWDSRSVNGIELLRVLSSLKVWIKKIKKLITPRSWEQYLVKLNIYFHNMG